jgi:hypothetical protein
MWKMAGLWHYKIEAKDNTVGEQNELVSLGGILASSTSQTKNSPVRK